MLWPTSASVTELDENTLLKLLWSARPRAASSPQAARDDRLAMVSPRPRAASIASVARLAAMNDSTPRAEPAPGSQLLVPEVMPNVWVPEKLFVVAANTCMKSSLGSKISEPSPQPADP